ncbi:hypothetical protein C5167_026495 [Papaver somniferum]|nr:hypothetical protein C5167_026495 [Papaver somniferum]
MLEKEFHCLSLGGDLKCSFEMGIIGLFCVEVVWLKLDLTTEHITRGTAGLFSAMFDAAHGELERFKKCAEALDRLIGDGIAETVKNTKSDDGKRVFLLFNFMLDFVYF